MRNINIPRPMAIPEPFAYSNQAKCLSENWTKLQQHFIDKTIKGFIQNQQNSFKKT